MSEAEPYNISAEMVKVAAGDPEAFTKVWEHETTRLLAILRSNYRSGIDYEDILQEAALRLWKNRGKFIDLGDDKLTRGYVNRVVINVLIDNSRSRKRSPQIEYLSDADQSPIVVADWANDVVRALDSERDIKIIKENKRDRGVRMFLLYEEGYSYKEIAMMENVPIGTVGAGIFKCKDKLRRVVQRDEG